MPRKKAAEVKPAAAATPFRDPPLTHRHECLLCGTIWSHDNVIRGLPCKIHAPAHACPRCQATCYEYYDGPLPPEFTNFHEKEDT